MHIVLDLKGVVHHGIEEPNACLIDCLFIVIAQEFTVEAMYKLNFFVLEVFVEPLFLIDEWCAFDFFIRMPIKEWNLK